MNVRFTFYKAFDLSYMSFCLVGVLLGEVIILLPVMPLCFVYVSLEEQIILLPAMLFYFVHVLPGEVIILFVTSCVVVLC